jgi:hypothetical protein
VEYVRNNQRNLSKNIIKVLLRYGAKVNIQTFMSCGQRDPFGILPYLTSSCDENTIEILANAAKQFHSRSILESDSLHHSQRVTVRSQYTLICIKMTLYEITQTWSFILY